MPNYAQGMILNGREKKLSTLVLLNDLLSSYAQGLTLNDSKNYKSSMRWKMRLIVSR